MRHSRKYDSTLDTQAGLAILLGMRTKRDIHPIRYRRKRLLMTQAELGALVGLDGSTISNIETGKSLALGRVPAIARALSTQTKILQRELDAWEAAR